MGYFMTNFRQRVKYFLLCSFLIGVLTSVLAGCGDAKVSDSPAENGGEANRSDAGLLLGEEAVETENAVYYIREQQTEEGIPFPQLELKGEKDIVCGADFLNRLLKLKSESVNYGGYQIFYADEDMLSLCFWRNTENGVIYQPLIIQFQCVNYQVTWDMQGYLQSVQDDNACPGAPIPGNGVRISIDALLQEVEKGSYEPEQVHSIQAHLQKMRDRGLQDTYLGFMEPYNVGIRGMYLKEERVSLFISLPERWEALADGASYENMPYDFRVEIAYDWKADLARRQVDYEVYRREGEDGAYGYLQVRGLGEAQELVNQAILTDLQENLSYLDLDKTNEIMMQYDHETYWKELPDIGPPRVTWQSGRYLCIRQEPLLKQSEMLRFVEEWRRYHVYDLETGKSLGLGDVLDLTPEFARWLQDEKKVRGWAEYHEGDTPGELGDLLQELLLNRYSEEQLLSALESAEFWMKEGALYFRLPFLGQWGEPLYSYGGTGYPNYLVYAECRVTTAELAAWINEEHRELLGKLPAGESVPGVAAEAVQEMPPAVRMLVGADYHIALCGDGTVWSWGGNVDGKLGIAVDALEQSERIPGLEDVVKLVDGGRDIFALTAGGEVYYWGWGLENIGYMDRRDDSMVYTPVRLQGTGKITALDGKNGTVFMLDTEGRLYSLGLCPDCAGMDSVMDVFCGHEELGHDIAHIAVGAGDYHYFIRKDGTVCSIMISADDVFSPCKFIFPAMWDGEAAAETYFVPEELECLSILKCTKPDHVVYYELAGVDGVEAVSADGYTVFVAKTDGTLWYWDSDRIRYHDDERALIDPESARESCGGSFVPIDIREILKLDAETPAPHITAMESGQECTMFLTDDGSVFVSRYETCKVEDVSCFVKGNPNPGERPSVETIEGMELKTLVFERLGIGNIVSISSDGKGNFAAVDADGIYSNPLRNVPLEDGAFQAYSFLLYLP